MKYNVYTLTFANGATYVGSTRDVRDRFRSHKKKMYTGSHSSKIMAAYAECGLPTLATVAETDDLATLHVLEQQVMDNTTNLLNTQPAQQHCGEKQSVAAECRLHGVDPIVYYWRRRHNWTHDEALGVTERVKNVHQRLITANGKTMAITAWAKQLGVTTGVIHNRLSNGWSEHDAVSTPKRVQTAKADKQPRKPREARLVTVHGFTGTIKEVAEHFGMSHTLLRSRMDAGWPEDQLIQKPRPSKLNIDVQLEWE